MNSLSLPLVQKTPVTSVSPVLFRFGIFLFLSIRWSLGVAWYLDRAYISKNLQFLPAGFFVDFFLLFLNFLVFVPLALSITAPPAPASRLAAYLNQILLGGREISTFLWILVLLLLLDSFWFVANGIWWFVTKIPFLNRWHSAPRRIHVFWAVLNILTLLVCAVFFLGHIFLGGDLQSAERWLFWIILAATVVDILGTVVEDTRWSQALSP